MNITEPRIKTKVKANEPFNKMRAKELRTGNFHLLKTHSNKYMIGRIDFSKAGFFSYETYDKDFLKKVVLAVGVYNKTQPVLFVCQRYPDGLDVMRVA